ncbi:hypothetical protein JTB14_025256 [Gonioctena quinquepunctata]|nr:hypothetical protein JTB14_025256 [Gonioctena quinquepunctata]
MKQSKFIWSCSLAAILAFACPLSHLIKLLNTAALVKCSLISCQLLYNRYKPEINYDHLVHNTNVQYSQLSRNPVRPSVSIQRISSMKDRVKAWFLPRPQYIHRVSSPNEDTHERECLLLDDYSNKSMNIDLAEDSASENGDDLVIVSDDEDSGSSTDIDLVVEEYKEGLKVATVGKFSENRRSTRVTSIIASICLLAAVGASVTIALYVIRIINILWPSILGLTISTLVLTALPQNAADESKETFLPSIIFPLFNITSIGLNVVLASTIILDIWQGIIFWSLAGLLLFWRCDCCTCDGLMRSPKVHNQTIKLPNSAMDDPIEHDYKEHIVDTIYITR